MKFLPTVGLDKSSLWVISF